MKHYTDTIQVSLAEKLKKKGMPMMPCFNIARTGSFSDDDVHFYCIPTFGACFDWLMEKGIYIRIIPFREWMNETDSKLWAWSWFIDVLTQPSINSDNFWMNWNKAAEKAIEKALTLI